MWRSSFKSYLNRSLTLAVRQGREPPSGLRMSSSYCSCRFVSSPSPLAVFSQTALSYSSSSAGSEGGNGNSTSRMVGDDSISCSEAKKLMRLVNVEALKTKLGMDGKEVICYTELLKACESMGVARSLDEAAAFAKVLDEAGVILLFRDKVYLHPDKGVDITF